MSPVEVQLQPGSMEAAMSQTSPQGKILPFPSRRQLRARAGTHINSHPELREAPPTAPLPFPITRLPQSPIVPEPVRLPHARQELRDLVASFRNILDGAEDLPDYMLPDACATLRVYARSLAGELSIPHAIARGAQ